MRPFDVNKALDSLTDHYPSADTLLTAAADRDVNVRQAMSRLWLSEGIPFAFKARPGTYEAVRIWLARRLGVQAKEVTIIGSGRQGFSLSPDPNIRRPFGAHSDLDFTVISPELFQRVRDALELWMSNYASGLAQPRNNKEREFWDANQHSCTSGLKRGFIDPYKIPLFDPYPEAQKVAQAMFLLHEKLKITPGAPIVRKPSLRIYRNWDSFVRQMAINLEAASTYSARVLM
jgi:hypothetical protein